LNRLTVLIIDPQSDHKGKILKCERAGESLDFGLKKAYTTIDVEPKEIIMIGEDVYNTEAIPVNSLARVKPYIEQVKKDADWLLDKITEYVNSKDKGKSSV